MSEITKIVEKQRNFFYTGKTKPIDFRKKNLIELKKILKSNEKKLDEAIYEDYKKSSFENYETELGTIYHELNTAIKNIKKWTRPKKVKTSLVNFPGKSMIYPEPLGVSLIIGAWNFPYNLTFCPLVPAICAGNTAIIKPSEIAKNSSKVIAELINNNFPEEYLYVQEGGVEETTELLNQHFDKIFFTGSPKVGKIVMEAAAKNLTPVTLELGGKNPAIVFEDANLQLAAKRIVWGKFLNAGQSCVAPDFLLVEKKIKEKFLQLMKEEILNYPGENPKNSNSYLRIINQNHTKRISQLIQKDKIVFGGEINFEENYISPTILNNISFEDKIMEEEIFGPVLPVIEFERINDIIDKLKKRPKSLALYLFTKNKIVKKKIINEISFGGGIINDTVLHWVNTSLPFGGVGQSGIGSYHNEAGFKEFSHYKRILYKTYLYEPHFKYPPYNEFKLSLIRYVFEKTFKK